jgi:hypothetical protein
LLSNQTVFLMMKARAAADGFGQVTYAASHQSAPKSALGDHFGHERSGATPTIMRFNRDHQ